MVSVGPPVIREELKDFMNAVERELQRHDPKKGGSWKETDAEILYEYMVSVFEKLEYTDDSDIKQKRSELIDLAALAMMTWSKMGLEHGLPPR